MTPRFTLRAGAAVCHVSITEAPHSSGHIVVDCNVHHEGPLDAEKLCLAIERWPECQMFVVPILTRLFEG